MKNTSLIEPPFNYTGSKFKSLYQLIPLFDTTRTRFVDLFSGGGSVWSNVVDLYPAVVANDIIHHLIDVQRKLITDPTATIATTRSLCVAKDDQVGYHKLRDDFNANPTPEKLWALMICCTNNMMRFNRSWGFNQTFGKRTFNDRTLAKATAWASQLQPLLDRIAFKSLDFEKVGVLPTDYLFLDPPYSNTEAGYNAYWRKDDDVRLFNWLCAMHERGVKFMVCGVASHDGERCRLLDLLTAKGFGLHAIEKDYSKVARVKRDKETQEVVILNYTPAFLTPDATAPAINAIPAVAAS